MLLKGKKRSIIAIELKIVRKKSTGARIQKCYKSTRVKKSVNNSLKNNNLQLSEQKSSKKTTTFHYQYQHVIIMWIYWVSIIPCTIKCWS